MGIIHHAGIMSALASHMHVDDAGMITNLIMGGIHGFGEFTYTAISSTLPRKLIIIKYLFYEVIVLASSVYKYFGLLL